MRRILSIIFLAASLAFAQDTAQVHATQAPIAARYELVQALRLSTLPNASPTNTATLRLDRYTGKVARFVSTSNGPEWQEMEIPDLPLASLLEPRFQITHRGYDADTLILLDTQSGLTWSWMADTKTRSGLRVWRLTVPSR